MSSPVAFPAGPVPGRPLLRLRGLCKRFGGTAALSGVDFEVLPGRIHALLGENGAGKSTLIKILAGIHAPDEGTIEGLSGSVAPGRKVPGIAFVHQDLGLVGTASVAENVALGTGFARRGGLIDWRKTAGRAAAALRALGVDLDPQAMVGRLSAAEKSMTAIARALAAQAQLIVLDEPTATLPLPDVARLHESLLRLRAQGLGIVYVTHRLDEVFALADDVTVLRDGAVRFHGPVASCSPAELVRHIIGRTLESMFPPKAQAAGPVRLVAKGLRSKAVGPVDLALRRGEILGLVGLRNSGQDVAGRMVAGALLPRSGTVELDGRTLPPGDMRAAIRSGAGFISSKRVEESLGPSLSLVENLFIDPRLAGLRTVNTPTEARRARAVLKRFDVRPPEPARPIATLSGGNQQKVVLARWLDRNPKLLVLEEPTVGVDVGARAEIYRLLAEAAARGMSALVVTSDFEEACGLCHRALVFGRGRPVAELGGDGMSVARIAEIAARDGVEQAA